MADTTTIPVTPFTPAPAFDPTVLTSKMLGLDQQRANLQGTNLSNQGQDISNQTNSNTLNQATNAAVAKSAFGLLSLTPDQRQGQVGYKNLVDETNAAVLRAGNTPAAQAAGRNYIAGLEPPTDGNGNQTDYTGRIAQHLLSSAAISGPDAITQIFGQPETQNVGNAVVSGSRTQPMMGAIRGTGAVFNPANSQPLGLSPGEQLQPGGVFPVPTGRLDANGKPVLGADGQPEVTYQNLTLGQKAGLVNPRLLGAGGASQPIPGQQPPVGTGGNLSAVVHQLETSGSMQPGVTGDGGAAGGVMQMHADALADVNAARGTHYTMQDLIDNPTIGKWAGDQYLDLQLQKYPGRPDLALAAYQGGPTALAAALASGKGLAGMPQATQSYVARGMALYNQRPPQTASQPPQVAPTQAPQTTQPPPRVMPPSRNQLTPNPPPQAAPAPAPAPAAAPPPQPVPLPGATPANIGQMITDGTNARTTDQANFTGSAWRAGKQGLQTALNVVRDPSIWTGTGQDVINQITGKLVTAGIMSPGDQGKKDMLAHALAQAGDISGTDAANMVSKLAQGDVTTSKPALIGLLSSRLGRMLQTEHASVSNFDAQPQDYIPKRDATTRSTDPRMFEIANMPSEEAADFVKRNRISKATQEEWGRKLAEIRQNNPALLGGNIGGSPSEQPAVTR